MPVCEQEYEDGVLQRSRVHLLGGRGIEAVVAIDHVRGNTVSLKWLLYDGHGNLVRTMAPDYTLSGWQFRGVWGELQGVLGVGRGYCANLGHPEDETGLVYMRARYYEPATGRFLSEDPARDGVNWYLYADGNPVAKVDEKGYGVITDIMGLLGGLFAMYLIARENPMFAALWVGWMGAFVLNTVGLSITYLALGTSYAMSFVAGSISGMLIGSLYEMKRLQSKSIQGQIIQFYEGYTLMILTTMALLDFEYTLLTGEGFAENLGYSGNLPRR